MFSHRAFVNDHRPLIRQAATIFIVVVAIPLVAFAQNGASDKLPAARRQKVGSAAQRVLLSPRFIPGQTFRYEMEFETTNATSRSGIASDPQGPSKLVIDWNSTVRIEILAADDGTPGGIRLRSTYEKSTASVRSDTFDPASAETQEQYRKLEGKVVEFTLDAAGKVRSVSGLEGMVDTEKAAQSARDWIAQLSATSGAPPGGVAVGQTWSSEQPASSLPLAGLAWRTDSEYLRNEPCRPPNPELPSDSGSANSAANSRPQETCAVILANLNLIRAKTLHDMTPEEFRKNGVQSVGKWGGSAQSLLYVSLGSGIVVSATQTGTEEMNVTITSSRNTSMRYSGTISSRSQVALVAPDAHEK